MIDKGFAFCYIYLGRIKMVGEVFAWQNTIIASIEGRR